MLRLVRLAAAVAISALALMGCATMNLSSHAERGLDFAQYRTYDCKPYVYDAGTLLLDFVDARTNKLVWRGWAERGMDGVIDNQEWMEEEIDEVVTRILERLPRRL